MRRWISPLSSRNSKHLFSQPFWIDVNDMTNADYQKVIVSGGYKQQGTWWTDAFWAWYKNDKRNAPHPFDHDTFTGAYQPRVGITWYEAYAYCQWRGARLPTEAEWEYAAPGLSDPIYPWGFHSPDVIQPAKVVSSVNGNLNTSAAASVEGGRQRLRNRNLGLQI